MNKYEKLVRSMSLDELYKRLSNIEDKEKALLRTRHENLIEKLTEYTLCDKRLWKDVLWISSGCVSFYIMQIFLAYPILDSAWKNYTVAGLCAVHSVMGIVAHRVGYSKLKKEHYDEIRNKLYFNPEKVEEFDEDAPSMPEDDELKKIQLEKMALKKYISIRKSEIDYTVKR